MKFSDASDLAAWLKANSFSTHRAVARFASGQLIAFGNDGGHKLGEPDLFCGEVRLKGAKIVARGTDDSQYSWVVLFEGGEGTLEEYDDLLWAVWNKTKALVPPSPEVEEMKRANNGRVADTVAAIEWSASGNGSGVNRGTYRDRRKT